MAPMHRKLAADVTWERGTNDTMDAKAGAARLRTAASESVMRPSKGTTSSCRYGTRRSAVQGARHHGK